LNRSGDSVRHSGLEPKFPVILHSSQRTLTFRIQFQDEFITIKKN